MRNRARAACLSLLLCCLLIGLAPAARAGSSDAAYRRRIGSIVATAMSRSAARGSTPGVIAARSGRTVYARNADTAMVPASLMKLVTTTASMIRFGSAYRFRTRVVSPAPSAQGVVAGSLAVIGSGDPTFASSSFGSRAFIRQGPGGSKVPAFATTPTTVEGLADKIIAAGVKRINGDVIADETIFDSKRVQPGWQSSYQQGSIDIGNLSGLPVNLGLDASGKKVAASPAQVAGTLVRDALRAKGVVITGTVRVAKAPASPAITNLTFIESPPLSEIVAWTNRWSINYAAEMLIKALGARFGGAGTTVAGAAVVRSALTGQKIDIESLRQEDGSGLSLLDRVRPRTLLQILNRMQTLPGAVGASLRDSLPVAGEPGTLLKRMTSSPTSGNLRGKTGLVRGVRALAGWVRTRDGSVLVYVALFNHVGNPAAMTAVHDEMGRAFAGLPS